MLHFLHRVQTRWDTSTGDAWKTFFFKVGKEKWKESRNVQLHSEVGHHCFEIFSQKSVKIIIRNRHFIDLCDTVTIHLRLRREPTAEWQAAHQAHCSFLQQHFAECGCAALEASSLSSACWMFFATGVLKSQDVPACSMLSCVIGCWSVPLMLATATTKPQITSFSRCPAFPRVTNAPPSRSWQRQWILCTSMYTKREDISHTIVYCVHVFAVFFWGGIEILVLWDECICSVNNLYFMVHVVCQLGCRWTLPRKSPCSPVSCF